MAETKGWMRSLASGFAAATLVLLGLPLSPSVATASLTTDGLRESDWMSALVTDDCEIMLRLGRPSRVGPATQLLPVQMRLVCDGRVAGLRLTFAGDPLPADINMRGGDAMLMTAVPLHTGQTGGELCLAATLIRTIATEITNCFTMPSVATAAPVPERTKEQSAAPVPERIAGQAGALPTAPTASARDTSGVAPPPVAAARPTSDPTATLPRGGVLATEGYPLDTAEAAPSGRPRVTRSGPDTSLKLPEGHSWALTAPALVQETVDNAIVRAHRNPASKASTQSAAPVQLPSLPGIQVLEATGGPIDATAADPPVRARRAAPALARPAETPLAPHPVPADGPQGGAADRPRPSHITEPPVLSGEGRSIMSSEDIPTAVQRGEPDTAIQRAGGPFVHPAMPKRLVKAGDTQPQDHTLPLAISGLMTLAAGLALRGWGQRQRAT